MGEVEGNGLEGIVELRVKGERRGRGARWGVLGKRISRMLTMGTDTGGYFSQPLSWRLRAVVAMLRSRETKSQNPSDHVSSVCGMAAVAGEWGLMHVSTLRVTVVVEIQIQGTY